MCNESLQFVLSDVTSSSGSQCSADLFFPSALGFRFAASPASDGAALRKTGRCFFFEEQIPTDHHLAYLEIHPFEGTTVRSVRPRIPHWWSDAERETALGKLLDELLALNDAIRPILWFYTPVMYSFARHVDASAIVYDCMDELANFKFAPPRLKETEAALIARADVVFTGGHSLYEAKAHLHDNIHPFPSSVDVSHFRTARNESVEPSDQKEIPGLKLGYYGVIDERLDLVLLAAVAKGAAEPVFYLHRPGREDRTGGSAEGRQYPLSRAKAL